ncbi:hypothetical protein V2G26_000909 [Clonostachys chloroleuca]
MQCNGQVHLVLYPPGTFQKLDWPDLVTHENRGLSSLSLSIASSRASSKYSTTLDRRLQPFRLQITSSGSGFQFLNPFRVK